MKVTDKNMRPILVELMKGRAIKRCKDLSRRWADGKPGPSLANTISSAVCRAGFLKREGDLEILSDWGKSFCKTYVYTTPSELPSLKIPSQGSLTFNGESK